MSAVGRLRPEVEVVETERSVILRYGFWETSLPLAWARGTQGFGDFLARKLALHDLATAPGLPGVAELLAAQGCLSAPPPPEVLSLRAVHAAFSERSSGAYGRYYAHPAWSAIRSGDRHALAGFLVHNLQLSQSVGRTAARAALRSSDMRARRTFLRNTREEYDHFARYFQVEHAALPAGAADFARAVPGPATHAFTLQMLAMAEHDWIAHSLVAWFQERTAGFADQAREFYAEVARRAGLGGFFDSWLAHVGYDRSSEHADAFREVFERDDLVERAELERAFRNASFAVHHLLGALDEIAALPGACSALLRLPPEAGRLDPRKTRLLAAFPGALAPLVLGAGDALGLLRAFRAAGLGPIGGPPALAADRRWLERRAARAALAALGNAERDEDVLAFGKLVELLRPDVTSPADLPATPACAVLGAALEEAAREPWRLALSLDLVLPLVEPELARTVGPLVEPSLARASAVPLDGTLTHLIQLVELLGVWQRESTAPPRDVFSW